MKTHRLTAAVLVVVQWACLLLWLPAPVRLVVSMSAGVLTVAVLARRDAQSVQGRAWLVVTTATTLLYNVVLSLTFLSHGGGSPDVGWGLVLFGASTVAGLMAAALFASFLGSVLASYLDGTAVDRA